MIKAGVGETSIYRWDSFRLLNSEIGNDHIVRVSNVVGMVVVFSSP